MPKVSFSYQATPVLEGVNLTIYDRESVCMVGPNGGGKTTQLRVLYGEQEPTAGNVVKSAADLRIAFLRQEFVDELVPSRTL